MSTSSSTERRDGTISRRGFFAFFGGALTLGFNAAGCGGRQARIIRYADQTGELIPNMFVSVKKDGRIGLAINKCEFGQGVTVGYSTLVAEELDVPLESVDFYFADSLPEYKTSFMLHQTGGSTSAKEAYVPLRQAAASAREMLVKAAAAEWKVSPAECVTENGEVLHRASGRKLGYGELTVKAARQPVPDDPKLKSKNEFKVIGKRDKRVDSIFKVTGTAKFGIDVVVPGMVRAAVIHGPTYGADAKSIRGIENAKKLPGVIDVFAVKGGVAIVAEKYWQALAAEKEVEVTWTPGDVAGLDTEKMRAAARAWKKEGASAHDEGDADKVFLHAPSGAKIDAVYDVPFLAHAPMEPQNCTVHVKADGKVEVWAPNQSPTVLAAYVAEAINVSASDVLVHTTYLGGGFGRRTFADWAAQAARIAKKVGRPVQMIWSRESDMTQAFYRPQATAHLRGSLTPDGKSVASFSAHVLCQPIILQGELLTRALMPGVPHAVQSVVIDSLFGMFGSNTIADIFSTEGIREVPYKIDNNKVEFTPIRSGLPVSSWRSVGNSINGFLVEGFIDELARLGKQDPYEFRRRMLENPNGAQALRVLNAVAKLSNWGTRKPGIGRGIARHFCFESEVAEVADVEIVDGRIKVRKVYAVVDCGIALNPDIVRAQVEGAIIMGLSAALDQEITLKGGEVQQTNFDSFPLLRMNECPEIVVEILDSDKPPTGIGEPGLPPIAPAVANAIFDLTGVRLRRMPLQAAYDEVRKS